MQMSRPRLQDMPPAAARFCLQVQRFVQEELQLDLHGARLLLALSAGVDSTALALCYKALQQKWGVRLLAAHLDHGLRPESAAEAEHVQNLCRELDIVCLRGNSRVSSYARARGLGLEEAGRILRYRFLHGLARKHGVQWILTGHHLNDLAEDMLLRQLRGAGWPALAGMAAMEQESRLLRPFLLCPKQQLQKFVHSLGLSWQEDPSNLNQEFMRNRIRHNLLPGMLRENPNFLQTVSQLWRQAELDHDFWEKKLQQLRCRELTSDRGFILPAEVLNDLHPALRQRWYKDALQRLGCRQTLASNLFALDQAWQTRIPGKTVQFPGHKKACISKQGIEFF